MTSRSWRAAWAALIADPALEQRVIADPPAFAAKWNLRQDEIDRIVRWIRGRPERDRMNDELVPIFMRVADDSEHGDRLQRYHDQELLAH